MTALFNLEFNTSQTAEWIWLEENRADDIDELKINTAKGKQQAHSNQQSFIAQTQNQKNHLYHNFIDVKSYNKDFEQEQKQKTNAPSETKRSVLTYKFLKL